MARDVEAKDDNPRPRKRRRQNESGNIGSQAKLKKEIRDVQRLLQRPLKANVREEKERALIGLKHELEIVTKSTQDHKMAKRYQMVRFFERQKATRRLRQAEKAYKEDQSAEHKEQVDRYTLDLYYTTHFPLTEKYIALYPKSGIESQEVLNKRDRIRDLLCDEMLHGKKKSSGSNKILLGQRMLPQTRTGGDVLDGHETQDEDIGGDSASNNETEEDEFLDMGHKRH